MWLLIKLKYWKKCQKLWSTIKWLKILRSVWSLVSVLIRCQTANLVSFIKIYYISQILWQFLNFFHNFVNKRHSNKMFTFLESFRCTEFSSIGSFGRFSFWQNITFWAPYHSITAPHWLRLAQTGSHLADVTDDCPILFC